MKYYYYLKYFLFIAVNWNPSLALFTLYHEIKGEKKYGLNTIRLGNPDKLSLKGNAEHAQKYQGSNYFLLEHLFEKVSKESTENNIIDFGCGKGRVMVVAAHYGFKHITGVEFAKELCEEARENIKKVKQKFPEKTFKIYHDDAAAYRITDIDNVFFFFNPFDETIMLPVVKNILHSFRKHPRKITVIYINPVHKEIFLSAGFEESYYIQKFHYIEASMLELSDVKLQG